MKLEEIKKVNLLDYAKTKLGISCRDNGMAHCPFHPPDDEPSFSIFSTEEGIWLWKDFHDDAAGSIIDLVARIRGIDKGQAIRELQDEFSSEDSAFMMAGRRILRSHTYRDRSGASLFKKVKYAIEEVKGAEYSFAWFHMTDDGWQPGKGAGLFIPYNLDKFADKTSAVICEGEKDAETITSLSGGVLLATSAPNGKGSWPDELTPHFAQFKDIFFLYDVGNDKDVRKHALKLHKSYPGTRVFLARVPLEEREADITDYLNSLENEVRADALSRILDKAEEISFGVIDEDETTRPGQTPVLVSLDSVEPETVDWLWHKRIPVGKLTFLAGQPAQGKSFFSLFLASQVTTGGHLPGDPQPTKKGSVIILSSEDGVADTIKPRALRMGADAKKIHILDGVVTKRDGQEFFDLTKHIPALETAIQKLGDARLVILDPISAYMGRADSHNNSEVRHHLTPLVALAAKHKVAVVCITHLNKAEGLSAMSRVMDSLAFIATSRLAWLIGSDPKDPTGKRKILALLKTNLSEPARGLAFTISEKGLDLGEEVDIDANELLISRASGSGSSLDTAKDWLVLLLAGGPVPSDQIYKQAKARGIPSNALDRARKDLGIKPRKEGFGETGRWVWELPGKIGEDRADTSAIVQSPIS